MDTWVDKYKPRSLEDLVLNDEQKSILQNYISRSNCPNMLLSGNPGVGKTTIAKLIPSYIENSTSLYINASDENGIDTVRNKIKDFVEASGFGGLKILILDEADGLSDQAQCALRNILESSLEDTRFILTCNYPGKIIEPIKSRCPEINLSFHVNDVIKRIAKIVSIETGNKTSKEEVIAIKDIVNKCFPDIRKAIGFIERCYASGEFKLVSVLDKTGAEKIIDMIMTSGKTFDQIHKCREYWIKNDIEFGSNYSLLGSLLYNAVESQTPIASLLIDLSVHLYHLDNSLDKEIQFHAMALELTKAIE